MGYAELLEKFSFDRLNKLYNEVTNRINIINLKESLENESDNTHLLNVALENIQFTFRKITEHELQIADEFRSELERTRKELERNFDKKDPKFVSLFEELKRLFKKKNIEELTSEEMNAAIAELEDIFKKASALNLKDQMLAKKYENDEKFVRIHKRINEQNKNIFNSELKLNEFLLSIKYKVDLIILNNINILDNQDFFSEQVKRIILEILESNNIRNIDIVRYYTNLLINEYYYQMAA